MRVSGLFLYPVKSLRGYAVDRAEIDALGLAGDRRFLLTDEHGRFLTQRTVPAMARIAAFLEGASLRLAADGAGEIQVPREPDPAAPIRIVTIWKHEGLQAEDCDPEATRWLTAFLGFECHLVRIGPKFHRQVLKSAALPGDLFAFNDGAPVLVTSEESLLDLNRRIEAEFGEPVPMNRFRPNVVLSGCAPFDEDRWPRFRAGDVALRNAGQSARCIMTTMDQSTGARMGKEPLRTLAEYRRDPSDPARIYFGTNYINESKRGTLRVGDDVQLLDGAAKISGASPGAVAQQ